MLNTEEIRNKIENSSIYYDNNEYDQEIYNQIYNFLSTKKKLIGIEYTFLCWLNYRFGWELKINSPQIPVIRKLSLNEFKSNFVLAGYHRAKMYTKLLDFIKEWKYNIDGILIGGSFVDIDNDAPRDIDAILLMRDKSYPLVLNERHEGLDLLLLPTNYCLNKFKAYYYIIYCGNKAQKKDSSIDINEGIENNEFKEREIIKIDRPASQS